jgi:alpha-mannosidase
MEDLLNTAERRPLYYTFANHMHWVDMQWLWGYGVLPGSALDCLEFCTQARVRGNLNFDGVGYERMAAECPEVLARLAEAVAEGILEPVGGSWGQPYGLFQGGESNVRQLTVGARAVLRHLKVRPQTFWEEEFWFFPQLPQLLDGCGYTGANLFFQWTWHTPEIPAEPYSLILWQGLDGTTLPTLPRNGLNLHQWPEDFDPMLESPLLHALEQPVLAQWLELLPSPDWMCRSEVLLPRLKELAQDSRFDFRPRTLSTLIAELDVSLAPTRAYSLEDVWHGMSLGKNADRIPRASLRGERSLLQAEILATLTGMLGRPYPSWDVYPTWEIDEAWRELLAAQHHDNHECEGLCGYIGMDSFDKAHKMAERISARSLLGIAQRLSPENGALVVANPLPWPRDVILPDGLVVREVPALGYRQADPASLQISNSEPVNFDLPYLGYELSVQWKGARKTLLRGQTYPDLSLPSQTPAVHDVPLSLKIEWLPHPLHSGYELRISAEHRQRWDPGMNAAFALDLNFAATVREVVHDHPFAQTSIEAKQNWPRKYPSGDWMTSKQWFEEVERPFTATRLLDVQLGGAEDRLLIVHDGSQSWQRTDSGLRVLLNLIDPWDEAYWNPHTEARFLFLPHSDLPAWRRHQIAEEWLSTPVCTSVPPPTGLLACVGGGEANAQAALPSDFCPVQIKGPVICTAFHRLGPREGEGLPEWAGHGMQAPHMLRLVELEGDTALTHIHFHQPVASAWLCNLMGEKLQPLRTPLQLSMPPHAIHNLIVDLPDAAKQARDLDARRKVWAQIHRHDSK